MLKRILVVLIGLTLIGGLSGCARSYTEVYGKVIDEREDKVSSFIMVGKVMMPTTRTDHYLKVEHRLDGEMIEQELSVGEYAYELCEPGDWILREKDGSIICEKESFR